MTQDRKSVSTFWFRKIANEEGSQFFSQKSGPLLNKAFEKYFMTAVPVRRPSFFVKKLVPNPLHLQFSLLLSGHLYLVKLCVFVTLVNNAVIYSTVKVSLC